jgi:stage II sporulation protein D
MVMIQMTGRKLLAHIIALIMLSVFFSGCGAPSRITPGEPPQVGRPTVRVLLPFAETHYTIACDGRYIVEGRTSDGGDVTYYCSRPVQIRLLNCLWELSEKEKTVLETQLAHVTFRSRDPDDLLSLDGKPYPGVLVCYLPEHESGPPQIINRVHVEDYLLGVLPPELGERTADEFEAVKAQAVAARTYALSHLGQYPGREYDLRADHFDQIYVGLQTPRSWVKKAVEQTAGEVLRHDGDLIQAYYHSTCGGSTDDIAAVWGKDPRPYLVMADDDTFCAWSKYSAWTETWDAATLHKNLQAYLQTLPDAPFPSFSRVLSMQTAGRTPGGRVQELIILTDQGSWTVRSDKIRWALGRPSTNGPILESARFSLFPEDDESGTLARLTAVGSGYGHGVGMCQCGTIGRARAGQDYREILTHYYSGAEIKKTY